MNIKTILTWFFAGLAFMVGIALASPTATNPTPTVSPSAESQVLTSPTPAPTPTATTIPAPTAVPTAKPTPTLKPTPTATPKPKSNCDPNYSGACVPIAYDVDCAGGSGNGPAYVKGPVYVIGQDIYGLDRVGNGIGCEK